MSIQLGERVIDAIIDTLQDKLPAELDLIDSERNDGIVLKDPEAYYRYQRPLMTENAVAVEVWLTQTDIQDYSVYTYGANRIDFEAFAKIRISFINREQLSPESVARVMERYQAALVRVLLENPQLQVANNLIQFARPTRFIPSESVLDESGMNHTVSQITAEITISASEINS
jgi:hypothetical protein